MPRVAFKLPLSNCREPGWTTGLVVLLLTKRRYSGKKLSAGTYAGAGQSSHITCHDTWGHQYSMKAPHLKQPRRRQPHFLTWLTVLLATTRKGGTDWLCWVCRRPARCRVSSSNWNTLMGP